MQPYPVLQVRDALRDKGDVFTLETGQTLSDARNLMMGHNVSRVVILWDRKYIVGIITEKDIIRFLYRDTKGRRLDEVKVEEVMSRDPVTGKKEESLAECANKMLDRKISSIIIVEATLNNEWALVGIITKTDIANAYASNYHGKYKVADFMSQKVYTLVPDDVIHDAMLLMVDGNISRVIVVENGKPTGIITMHDLLPVGSLVNPFFNSFEQSELKLKTTQPTNLPSIPAGINAKLIASDIMRTNISTITQDHDLADAARIMVEKKISSLPVIEPNDKDTNKNGNLVGLITKTDITKAMVSAQAASATEA